MDQSRRAAVVSYYDVLGVTAEADRGEIQRAFRVRARQVHPDVGGDPVVFRQLRDAYECLLDRDRRREHDSALGIRRGGPTGTASAGFAGRAGDFTGDVDFPAYLRDIVDRPWQTSDRRGAAGTTTPAAGEPTRSGVDTGPVATAWRWTGVATHVPVVAGPVVVVAGDGAVAAVDPWDGRVRWEVAVAPAVARRPVARGDLVVLAPPGGGVEAYEVTTGRLRWRQRLGEARVDALCASSDAVLVGTGPVVAALDAATGARRWATKLAGPVVRLLADDDHVVAATARGTLHGLRLARGRQRWWCRAVVAHEVPPVTFGDLQWWVVRGGRLVGVSSESGRIGAEVVAGSAVAGLVPAAQHLLVSVAGPSRVVALDTRGTTRWDAPLSAVAPTPEVLGDCAVVVTPLGEVRTLDLSTGTAMATGTFDAVPAGPPVGVSATPPGGPGVEPAPVSRVLVVDAVGTVHAFVPPGLAEHRGWSGGAR